MDISIFVDFILIVLLAATLHYCWRLNQRLEAIRAADQDLQKLLGAFNAATESAQRGIAELRSLSESRGRNLELALEKAQKLADELSIMTDSGNRLADRLDKSFSQQTSSGDYPADGDQDLLRSLRRIK